MKEIKIAICDDEEFFRDELEMLVSVYANETETALMIDTFSSAEQIVDAAKNNQFDYDLMFLDIEMLGASGFEAAEKLREIDNQVLICIVSSHLEYAMSAFKVDAVGYVEKPAKYIDVKKMMEKTKIQIYYQCNAKEAEKRYIQIATNREKVRIDINRIIYIEKRRNQCVFHLTDSEIVCYETLSNVYQKLDPQLFLYTHQGFIVNFNFIKEVKKTVVCFGSGMEIPISRRYYQRVRDLHMNKIYQLIRERDEKEKDN